MCSSKPRRWNGPAGPIPADHWEGLGQDNGEGGQRLLSALPPDLQQCVVSMTAHDSGRDKHREQLFAFKAFEVYVLCCVTSELASTLAEFMTLSKKHTEV